MLLAGGVRDDLLKVIADLSPQAIDGLVLKSWDIQRSKIINGQGTQAWANELVKWGEDRGVNKLRILIETLKAEYPNPQVLEATESALERLQTVAPTVEWAMVSGRTTGLPFVNRESFRDYVLNEFSGMQSMYRVVTLQGDPDSGKSWCRCFINYVSQSLGVDLVTIDLLECEDEDISALYLFDWIRDEAMGPTFEEVLIDHTARPQRQAKTLIRKFKRWGKTRNLSGFPALWVFVDHIEQCLPFRIEGAAGEFLKQLARLASMRDIPGFSLLMPGVPADFLPNSVECCSIQLAKITVDDIVLWLEQEIEPVSSETERLEAEARKVLDLDFPKTLHRQLNELVVKLKEEFSQ